MKKVIGIIAVILLLLSVIGMCTNLNEPINDSTNNIEENNIDDIIETQPEDTSHTNQEDNNVCLHSNTSIKNSSDATCTEDGYTGDTYCKDCGTVIKTGSTVKATGHNTKLRNKKEATTTTEGYTGDTYCTNCKKIIKSGEKIPKIETQSEDADSTNQEDNNVCLHSSTIIINSSDATCTENGYTGDTYCKSCDTVIKEGSTIKAKGHDTEIRNKTEATSTTEGYTGDTYCTACEKIIKSGEKIPKIEDNTSETVYTTETGKKYHSRKSCPGLSNANTIYETTLEKAKKQGLTPCSKCH